MSPVRILICIGCIHLYAFENLTAQDFMIESFSKHSGKVNSVKFRPGGVDLLTGGEDRVARLWTYRTGMDNQVFTGHYSEVLSVSFLPKSDQVLATSGNVALLYNMDGKLLRTFRGQTTAIWSVSVHPDGQYFATGSFEKNIRVWNMNNHRTLFQLEGHLENSLAVCFSPDGKHLISGSLDETIIVWDFESREIVQVLPGHTGNIYSIVFSPDGKYFASASSDNTIRLWDAERYECQRVFKGHEKSVFSLIFNTKGDLLLSGSADHTIKVWQVANGNLIHTFAGHSGIVSSLDYNPAGNVFASGSHDGTVKTWHLSEQILIDFYFGEEFIKDIEESGLNKPRLPDESRSDYRSRVEELNKLRDSLRTKYVNLYRLKLESGELPMISN
jgi:WD40 repeat protein